MFEINRLWAYRYFILMAVKSDFQTRFSRSFFGGLWGLLNPLAQAAIYAFVLSYVLSAKLPGVTQKYGYSMYLLSGIVGWALFNDTLLRSLNMFHEKANEMQKVAFPRLAIPTIVLMNTLLDNIILILSVILVALLLGHQFSLALLWLPLLVVLNGLIAGSFGLFLGVLNVFVRDIGHIITITMQFVFWLTPIVYSLDLMPEGYRKYFLLNPFYHIVSSYQNVIFYGQNVELGSLTGMIVLALTGCTLAFLAYRKSYSEMMDVL